MRSVCPRYNSSAPRRHRCRPRTRPTSTGKHSSTPATGTQPARAPASAPLVGVVPAPASAHSYSYLLRRSSANRPPHPHPTRLLRATHPHPPPYAPRRSRSRRTDTPPRSYLPRRTRRPHRRRTMRSVSSPPVSRSVSVSARTHESRAGREATEGKRMSPIKGLCVFLPASATSPRTLCRQPSPHRC
ncbi:hypothetical protein B0H14DRAFT_1454617 [Mycena olivaceomarginata]|nr:hypothetical protein B0H14DRAFT_1454617 [Mycena olivaceomarginata]